MIYNMFQEVKAMAKYRAIPDGYMTVGEAAKKNGNHCTHFAILRQRGAALSIRRKRGRAQALYG